MEKNDDGQWVAVGPFPPSCQEPHIVQLLITESIELQDPTKLYYLFPHGPKHKYFRFKLGSAEEAMEFRRKFHGHTFEESDGEKVKVQILEDYKEQNNNNRALSSTHLKITNLDPAVREGKLRGMINDLSSMNPPFLELHLHSEGELPSYAIVGMATHQQAQEVVDKLIMAEIAGQRVWAKQTPKPRRNPVLRGKVNSLEIGHLPLNMEMDEIEAMCAEYGDVLRVKEDLDRNGYFQRSASVVMSTAKEAAAVFDRLHDEKVRGCRIITRFRIPNTTKLFIGWFPKSVTKEDVSQFVIRRGRTPGREPFSIDLVDGKTDSNRAAFVELFDPQEVAECVSKLNGKELGGVEVSVRSAKKTSGRLARTKASIKEKVLKGVLEQGAAKEMWQKEFSSGRAKMKGRSKRIKGKMLRRYGGKRRSKK